MRPLLASFRRALGRRALGRRALGRRAQGRRALGVCAVGLCVLGLALSGCAPTLDGADLDLARPAADQRLLEAEPCDEATLPGTVAVLTEVTVSFGIGTETTRRLVCSGTLIAPDVVLTAAHCLDPMAVTLGFGQVIEESYVVTERADLQALSEDLTFADGFDELMFAAAAWQTHPDFELSSLQSPPPGLAQLNDVAVLLLAEPLLHVRPWPVATADELADLSAEQTVSVSGWGQTVPDPQSPFEPPAEGSLGVKHCAQTLLGEVGEFEMQVGTDADSPRKCHGDSGGPTFLDVAAGADGGSAPRLIGVTSRAYDSSDCAVGGVDTRVDGVRDWLQTTLTAACDEELRSWCDISGLPSPDQLAALELGPAPMLPQGGDGDGDGDMTGDGDGDGDGDGTGDGDGDGDGDKQPLIPPELFGCQSVPTSVPAGLGALALWLLRRRRRPRRS